MFVAIGCVGVGSDLASCEWLGSMMSLSGRMVVCSDWLIRCKWQKGVL